MNQGYIPYKTVLFIKEVLQKQLEDVFGDWKYRIPVWIHTYFEQQRLFLKE